MARRTGSRGRIRRRTLYVSTMVLLLGVIGGFAFAATMANLVLPVPGGPGGSGAGESATTAFTEASVTSVSVLATNPESAAAHLGSETGPALGVLEGTMAAQTGTSPVSVYGQPAAQSTATPVSNDYSVQVVVTVTTTGTAFGFDMQFTIPLSSGTVVADIYVDTGTVTAGTLTLYVFVDSGVLNSATPPTFATYAVSANGCLSPTACP